MTQGLPFKKGCPYSRNMGFERPFENDEAFYQTLNQVFQSSKAFKSTYQNQLKDIETVERALKDYEDILIQLDRLYNYPELRVSVDATNEAAQK